MCNIHLHNSVILLANQTLYTLSTIIKISETENKKDW